MDKLEAVNYALMLNGHLRVGALATTGAADASAEGTMEYLIDQEDEIGQCRVWLYNEERKFSISPTAITNKIAVPAGTLEIAPDGDDAWRVPNLTQRGGFIYDIENQTYEFDDAITFRIVSRLSWGCIPHPVQHYLAACAAEKFWSLKNRNRPELLGAIRAEIVRRKVAAEMFNSRVKKADPLDQPADQNLRGGRRRGFLWSQSW